MGDQVGSPHSDHVYQEVHAATSTAQHGEAASVDNTMAIDDEPQRVGNGDTETNNSASTQTIVNVNEQAGSENYAITEVGSSAHDSPAADLNNLFMGQLALLKGHPILGPEVECTLSAFSVWSASTISMEDFMGMLNGLTHARIPNIPPSEPHDRAPEFRNQLYGPLYNALQQGVTDPDELRPLFRQYVQAMPDGAPDEKATEEHHPRS